MVFLYLLFFGLFYIFCLVLYWEAILLIGFVYVTVRVLLFIAFVIVIFINFTNIFTSTFVAYFADIN
jgi:hypothetical protein